MAEALYPGAATFPGATTFPGQPVDIWHKLWASFDDVGTPHHERTWVDLSGRMRGWGVEGGAENELGEVDATVASYELADPDRDLDPTNSASPYDPVPNRLLWHRAQTNNQTYGIFKGYVDGWGPTPHPDGIDLHSANVTASDGEKILIRGNLEAANPDVVEWDEMISALDPSFYYRLGEPQGTKLVGHRRVIKHKKGKKKGKWKRTKRWKTRETRAETTGVSGPGGTYKNTPALGQPGAIAGDSDTSVLYRAAQSERAVIPVDVDDSIATNRITMVAWAKPVSPNPSGSIRSVIVGPQAVGGPSWSLRHVSGLWDVRILTTTGSVFADGPEPSLDVWVMLAATWDGSVARFYLNGQLTDATSPAAATMVTPASAGYIGIGEDFDGYVDEVAIFEKVLTQPQIQALYTAARLGFDGSLTGRRIENVLALVDEFPAWNIQPGVRTMTPTRYAGLEPMEFMNDAVAGEGFPCAFFMSKDGVPTFLPADYRDRAPYDAPLFTVGTGMGEIPFLNPQLSDEDDFLFNIIRGTAEGSEQTFTASDPTSIGRFGRSVLPLDDLPIGSDADVQDYVDELLALYKDPVVRITGFTLNGETAAERDALLTLDQKDCVRVHFQPEGGGTEIDQTSFVEHRRVWQDHAADPLIYGEFSVSPV